MNDRYHSFAQLAAAESEGIDYRIRIAERQSPVLVLAPHGGWIEPGTSELAAAIAESAFSLYCFEGLVEGCYARLHITSHRFDEPKASALVAAAAVVVAIHGRLDRDDPEAVWMGGRDTGLRDAIGAALIAAGFAATADGHEFPAESRENICNRGRSGAGVQLELPRTLRDAFARDAGWMNAFAAALRSTIDKRLSSLSAPLGRRG
jgi:phage replication-related protein YjqB (UPF0714/DUF867 family)